MNRKLLIFLLPMLVIALSVTYAAFSSKLYVGTSNSPNVVQTGYLKWKIYFPSELGYSLPSAVDGVIVPYPPYIIIPEQPDVGNTTIEKVNSNTVRITILNAYPGYVGISDFIYVNNGSIPSKLRDVNITVSDPDGLGDKLVTGLLMIWDSDGPGPSPTYGALVVGYNLTYLPTAIKTILNGVVFTKGGYIAFCKPNSTNVTIKEELINPNSGLTQDEINALINNTNCFIVVVPPNATPPQGAVLSFNLTLTFGQYNEP